MFWYSSEASIENHSLEIKAFQCILSWQGVVIVFSCYMTCLHLCLCTNNFHFYRDGFYTLYPNGIILAIEMQFPITLLLTCPLFYIFPIVKKCVLFLSHLQFCFTSSSELYIHHNYCYSSPSNLVDMLMEIEEESTT